MRTVLTAIVFLLIGMCGSANATQTVTGTTGGSYHERCLPETGRCTCRGTWSGTACRELMASGSCAVAGSAQEPWSQELEDSGEHWSSFLDCNLNSGVCSCPMAPEAPRNEGELETGAIEPATENAHEPGRRDPPGPPGATQAPESAVGSSRNSEVVPTRRGRLPAPSALQLRDIGRTSLVFLWRDNAISEYGVSVERGTPELERGGINYNWQHVFNVEERVMSQVEGTGWRSDGDDGLTPGTAYCYRLRAYDGEYYSAYSARTCRETMP